MTTKTETLEELHLALAERLPELQLPLLEAYRRPSDYSDAAIERGWVPNVTTDGLLEALFKRFPDASLVIERTELSIEKNVVDGDWLVEGLWKGTHHEALCRAALKALEAS